MHFLRQHLATCHGPRRGGKEISWVWGYSTHFINDPGFHLVPEERGYFLSPVLSKVVVTFALCCGGVTVTEQQFLIPAEPWALLILPLTGEPDKAWMEEWVQPFYPPVCPSKLCRCGETHLLLLFGGELFHWRAGSPPEAPQRVLHSYKLPMLNIYIGFRLALCVTG